MAMTHVPIIIETEFGDIEATLDAEHAPGTAANFLKYVDADYYALWNILRDVVGHWDLAGCHFADVIGVICYERYARNY